MCLITTGPLRKLYYLAAMKIETEDIITQSSIPTVSVPRWITSTQLKLRPQKTPICRSENKVDYRLLILKRIMPVSRRCNAENATKRLYSSDRDAASER